MTNLGRDWVRTLVGRFPMTGRDQGCAVFLRGGRLRPIRAWAQLVFVAVYALFPMPALALKGELMSRWLAEGKCAEVVRRIDEWEEKSAFGSEDYELRRLRSQAAFCQAKQGDDLASWSAYVARFGDWPEAADARIRLYDLAFSAAQLEGTAASMEAYVAAYPGSPHLVQARAQAEAWAFEDAAKSGDPKAIERFLAEHPNSAMREQAWEAMVQTTEGIYLVTPDGEPQRITGVPIAEGGYVVLPSGLPVVEAFPVIGVNQPGAGRGETSVWWNLQSVEFDADGVARLSGVSPVERVLSDRLGVGPAPVSAGLLDLIVASGTHLARVATTRNPLAVAKYCYGFRRFALTLRSPGTPAVAFPFAVDCPRTEGVATPLGLLLGAMDAAEAGQRTVARQRYEALLARPDAAGLLTWLNEALPGDLAAPLIEDRPGIGDWIVWTRGADGNEVSRWIRVDGDVVRVMRERPGWAVAGSKGLVTAAADGECESPLGGLGNTLFCASPLGADANGRTAPGRTRPTTIAVSGTAIGWDLASDEAFSAAGISPLPELEAIEAVTPQWQAGLKGVWRVVSAGRSVEVVADAPLAWTKAVQVPPALAAWLDANASGVPIGLSVVSTDAWATWKAFGL